MWNRVGGWITAWRGEASRAPRRVPRRPDPADMGIDVGLDEALESRLPPLMDWVAARPPSQAAVVAPLGTDRRSRIA